MYYLLICKFLILLVLNYTQLLLVASLKGKCSFALFIAFFCLLDSEFSLARYSDTAVYSNNSVISINLVGEGYSGLPQITAGGALECHTNQVMTPLAVGKMILINKARENGTFLMGLLFPALEVVLFSTEQEITWLFD